MSWKHKFHVKTFYSKRVWLRFGNTLIGEPLNLDATRTFVCVCGGVRARLSMRICIYVFIHVLVVGAVSSVAACCGISLVAIQCNQISGTCSPYPRGRSSGRCCCLNKTFHRVLLEKVIEACLHIGVPCIREWARKGDNKRESEVA